MVFDNETLNKIISIALIVLLIVFGLVQLAGIVTGHPVSWVESAVIAVMALLQAYRHSADVKNGNGSSGLKPPSNQE